MRYIGDFADWDLSGNRAYLQISRALINAAYGTEPPSVVDPFAGGGSIPVEALRLGCSVVASDLNPVARLMLKVLLEDIPRNGKQLSHDLTILGDNLNRITQDALRKYFPSGDDKSHPIAYLWARTVRCESPNCGAEIPIYRSPWLSKRTVSRAKYFAESPDGNCVALLIKEAPKGGLISFRIAKGHGSENPREGYINISGTKAPGNNANVVCPCCGTLLPGNKTNPRTPLQLSAQRGGASVLYDENGTRVGGARLLAVVTMKPNQSGRLFRLPTESDEKACFEAKKDLDELIKGLQSDPEILWNPLLDEPLPPLGTLGFRVQRYGVLEWGDLFTDRQKLTLLVLLNAINGLKLDRKDLKRSLACAFSRVAMSNMSCTRWNPSAEKMQHTFGRQALPLVWDFAEVVPIADAPGNWASGYQLVAEVAARWLPGGEIGQAELADAANSPLGSESTDLWFTDPPYYDAVPYADLSDFFFVWLKRIFWGEPSMRDPFDSTNPLTPKIQEVVQDVTKTIGGRPKDRAFFEENMAKVFREGRRLLKDDGLGCVVFAHKTTEGWEALLSGMARGGWTITGSWPIATEMGSRLRARDSAALATSVHLVCRPRPENAPVGDWGEVLRELPGRVGEWMERLQAEGIRGADLVFACIGPALEIFSRYSAVETAEGSEVKLADYLEKVWEVVGRTALEQVLGTAEAQARNGMVGALEEDARLTALFLWTLQSTNGANGSGVKATQDEDADTGEHDDEEDAAPKGKVKGFSLIFDVVRRFAQPLGIALPKWEGRIIETKKGIVRLLAISERSKQLFGENGPAPHADWITEQTSGPIQLRLFPERIEDRIPRIRGAGRGRRVMQDAGKVELRSDVDITTLDRVHAAMLLQAGGLSNALRALIKDEQDRGPDFLRLANALSALYPLGSEEKRLIDAMLLAAPR